MSLIDKNAEARAAFFAKWPCLTSEQVLEAVRLGSTSQTKRHRGKLLSVRYKGRAYFPALQFRGGEEPHETVTQVLRILGGRKSGWQMAFWFTSPNGWLDGRKPAECLDEKDAVMSAASQEAKAIVG